MGMVAKIIVDKQAVGHSKELLDLPIEARITSKSFCRVVLYPLPLALHSSELKLMPIIITT